MNCTTVQRRLLGSERPDQPPAEVKDHLARCPACRACHRRLLELERQIPALPVPPSAGPARLLQRLQQEPAASDTPRILPLLRPTLRPPAGVLAKERGLRKLALAAAMAAALAVFAVGWWFWPRGSDTGTPTTNPPFRDSVAELKDSIEARRNKVWSLKTARERVQMLAKLADDLHRQAQDEVGDPARLAVVVEQYGKVVKADLFFHAKDVPREDRAGLFPEVAGLLQRNGSRASQLALQMAPEAARPFKEMAAVAQEGNRRLLAMVGGENA